MQKKLPKIYLFVNDFIPLELNLLNSNISIIYRNYKKIIDESTLISLKIYCKARKRKLYLANDIRLAIKLKLNGAYIPSFNRKLNLVTFPLPKDFELLGSAHNQQEIKIKKTQGCTNIFLAPAFKVNKKNNFFGVNKFNLITLRHNNNFIALGGINKNTVKKIKLLRCVGFSGISWIKKNGLRKLRPSLNNLTFNN